MGTLRTAAVAVTVAACAFVFATSANADPYISMGDSSSTGEMYPGLLYGGYAGHQGFDQTLGADEHVSLGQGGQVLAGLKVEQLPAALAAIDASDDTKAVTIGIGGNDGLGSELCFGSEAGCPAWQASYLDMVRQVREALDRDPGEEFFGLLSYYNPFRWDGSGISQNDQDRIDLRLLGTNLVAEQCPADEGIGLNDIIRKAGSEYGAVVADPYDAFLNANGTFLADSIHANEAGNEAIVDAFFDPVRPIDCDPPEPTCETDSSLCPPEPTCETDASLCPRDLTAPNTFITAGPRRSRSLRVTFRFRSNEPGSTFQCSIDARPFRRCASPKRLRLKRGRHRFRVRAIDSSGNVDRSPARRHFRIR